MHRPLVSFVAALLAITASPLAAQFPAPQLNNIFPCGAKQGTEVECTVGGGELAGATGLYFSHPDIKATPAGPSKFKVSVPDSVPVGRYDVRAICPLGLSSCRSFIVGDRAEFVEKEPNNEAAKAEKVTLPVTVNGQISGGIDLDFFTFAATKGQRIIINCWAWRFDSRLDATLMLYDKNGKELGYSGDYYGKDPLIDFTAPEDGEYTVKVWDFIFTSGSDFVYRLEIGSLPHLDAILPAAVKPGEATTVTLYGRNLPGGKPAPSGMEVQGRPLEMLRQQIKLDATGLAATSIHGGEAVRPPQALLDGVEYRLNTNQGSSNALFVGFTDLPVVLETDNDSLAAPQKLAAPFEVSGMFSPVGDLDYYSFRVKKERLVIEVFGERQSGLVDPTFNAYDSTGKRVQTGDDSGRNIGQLRFTTNTRDARWDFNNGKEDDFTVQVRDLYRQQRGDPRFTYRLSVRPPRPDFRLVAVPTAETQPDSTTVRRGGRYWLDVLVNRDDNFDEPITVTAADLPTGVTAEPVVIGRGKSSVPLVFQAAADAPLGHHEIEILGKAMIDEHEVVRSARAGGLVWSTVNTPGIARMFDTVVLSVREPAPFVLTAKPAKNEVSVGDKLTISVEVARAADWNDDVQLAGFDLPQNATVALFTVKKGQSVGTVELTLPANTKPGPYSFTINGSGQMPKYYAIEQDPSKRGPNLRGVIPSNAITINVLAPEPKK